MSCPYSQCRLSSAAGSAAGSDGGGTAAGHPQQLPAPGSGQPVSNAPAVAPLGPRLPSHSADHDHAPARPAHPNSGTPDLLAAAYSVHRAGGAAADSSNGRHASQHVAQSSNGNSGNVSSDSTAFGQQSQQHGANTAGRSGSSNPAPRTPSSALPSRASLGSAAHRLLFCLI
jgi:hypothetical protein